MRVILSLLIATAGACAASTPAPQPAAPPPPAEPAIVDQPLSAEVLVRFVGERFPDAVAAGTITLDFGNAGIDADVLGELAVMGIDGTAELAAIVPDDFATRGIDAITAAGATTTIAGLLRDLMIIHDVRGYFTRAWNHSWVAGPADFPAPVAYGVDVGVMEELGVFDEGGAGED